MKTVKKKVNSKSNKKLKENYPLQKVFFTPNTQKQIDFDKEVEDFKLSIKKETLFCERNKKIIPNISTKFTDFIRRK